jgi:hypothetical protein
MTSHWRTVCPGSPCATGFVPPSTKLTSSHWESRLNPFGSSNYGTTGIGSTPHFGARSSTHETTMNLAHCIMCGCHDYAACIDDHSGCACHWLVVDYEAGMGVCSSCPEGIERWDAGDRTPEAPTAAAGQRMSMPTWKLIGCSKCGSGSGQPCRRPRLGASLQSIRCAPHAVRRRAAGELYAS